MLESMVIVSKPMSFLLQPLNVFFAVLVEHVRKQQEMVIEYLQLENQVLREKLAGKRVLLNDDQRRLLASPQRSVESIPLLVKLGQILVDKSTSNPV